MHIFHIALFNSYITYLDLAGKNRTDITYLEYTQMFLKEMRPPLAPSSKYRPHTPMTPGHKPQSKQKKKEEELTRKTCKTCTYKTATWCKECGVYLCINTVYSKKTCWSDYHEKL